MRLKYLKRKRENYNNNIIILIIVIVIIIIIIINAPLWCRIPLLYITCVKLKYLKRTRDLHCRCEQKGCSRQGEPEQRTTGNYANTLSFYLAPERVSPLVLLLLFVFCFSFSLSELAQRVRDRVYTEKHYQMHGSKAPLKKGKAK